MPAKLEIEKIEQISGSKYNVEAVKGWLEIADAGFTDASTFSVGWNDKALVATVNGSFAGLIVWKHNEWAREVFIALGYVAPRFREKGVYKALFAELCEVARTMKARTVSGGIDPRNKASIRAAQAMGRKARSVSYELQL